MSSQSQRTRSVISESPVIPGSLRSDTIEHLELRLVDGYHRIEVARAKGDDVSVWEDFWIELLHRYETLCDGQRVAA